MLIQGSSTSFFLVMFALILESDVLEMIRLQQAVKQEQEEQEQQWQILTLHYTFILSAVELFCFS